jgi:hypothetical protein
MSDINIIDMSCIYIHCDLEAPRRGLFENTGVLQHSIGGINGDRWIARSISELSTSPAVLQAKNFAGISTCSERSHVTSKS